MMNKKLLAALLVCHAGSVALPACGPPIHYDGLGPVPHKTAAVLFGAALIGSGETRERVVAMHPRGTQLFFTSLSPTGPQIMQSQFRDGQWQAPVRATFSDVGVNTEPSFAPDGRTLYFVSMRPPARSTDIWKTEYSDAGWSAPTRLDAAVNSDGYEWHPQAAANGDLYFAAGDRSGGLGNADLYVSAFRNGAYQPAENLGTAINSAAAEWDPYVSPAGDLLMFKSDRPGGRGGMDLYASMRKRGVWSVPRNLGPAINTADDEDSAELTPDGRYLIFARSRPAAEAWKLYWIDAGAAGFPARCGR